MTDKAKKRILVVDTEVNVCKSIRHALLCESYEIDVALSEREALDKEKEKAYDVFIIDVLITGRDEIGLVQSLKASNPSAKVIVTAGYPTSKTTVQSMQLGAFDCLPKPFLPSDLRNLISRALESGD